MRRELPSTRNTDNFLNEELSCIYCRIGIAKRTKEGLFYCRNCGRYQQRGFSLYRILPER